MLFLNNPILWTIDFIAMNSGMKKNSVRRFSENNLKQYDVLFQNVGKQTIFIK